ncbi:MAG: FABP family protein [Actinobacteria bacterium]|nr:FABP family protein [Actinomycetota bacterium]MBU1608028.1 FABP family protein [Actinomycetota bacterium]MBU2315900.1 FABP family protein [Actinomycetota bacterium]MBU2385900.1 FABP family protein [Actinomycetota bacterium]
MFSLDSDLPAELAPLAWLLGLWEGTGVVHYVDGDQVREHEFGQRVSFSHDGLHYLNYSSQTWLLDEANTPLSAEAGYWRLHRPSQPGDPGPGMLPGDGARPFATADEVETLRTADGFFDVEVAIIHPGGVSELYLGRAQPARIDLQTDAVMRSASAKDYSAATRLYGLVEGRLLWAWDIAALGNDLRTHASGTLNRQE